MSFWLRDTSEFELVLRHRGRKVLASPEQTQAIRSRQRRYRQPKPPPIQILLKRAYQLKERLDTTPGLTRDALAKEIGTSPTRLTMTLNLLNLAPEIQQHILVLPPLVGWRAITDRRIRPLVRMRDHVAQRIGFQALLRGVSEASISH